MLELLCLSREDVGVWGTSLRRTWEQGDEDCQVEEDVPCHVGAEERKEQKVGMGSRQGGDGNNRQKDKEP